MIYLDKFGLFNVPRIEKDLKTLKQSDIQWHDKSIRGSYRYRYRISLIKLNSRRARLSTYSIILLAIERNEFIAPARGKDYFLQCFAPTLGRFFSVNESESP